MTYAQIQQLIHDCHRLGLNTLGELAAFKAAHGCKTNAELLTALQEA